MLFFDFKPVREGLSYGFIPGRGAKRGADVEGVHQDEKRPTPLTWIKSIADASHLIAY